MAWEVPVFRTYLTWTEDELLLRLADNTYELANVEQELELSLATEHQVRYQAFIDNPEGSFSLRDGYAKAAALTATVASHECKGLKNALLIERQFIYTLLGKIHEEEAAISTMR